MEERSLHEERSTTYELKQEADGSILIAASQTRSVAVGYRALSPNHMPPLAVTLPPTEVTTPRKEYVLVWYNHSEPKTLYRVNQTKPGVTEIDNDRFKQWCSPLDPSNKKILSQIEVLGDEQFKQPDRPNWWTKPPYNLPALQERWAQIMDDDRWYVVELEDEASRKRTTKRKQ